VGQGKELPFVNPLVAIYNTVSLRHFLPVGGEDLARVEGDLELRFAGAADPEVELLGEPAAARPFPGEVVYADRVGALCRCWNWREAERTCLRAETTEAVLVTEALAHRGAAELDSAVEDLAGRVAAFLGGRVATGVADRAQPGVNLDA
jgi:DNA/RNA-binding domain of Phe-tRNA-synthetase-like protein